MVDRCNSAEGPHPTAGQDWTDPVLGMELIWIESLQLWVGKHHVTNGEFRAFRPEHCSGDYEGLSLDQDRQPVCCVSYDDGMAFSSWLRNRYDECGLEERFIVRLPNHREWPLFASCGHLRIFPWGNDWPPPYGNYGDESAKRTFNEWDAIEGYDDGFPVSCPVEDSGRNEWGLYGVGGNVYEWTFEAGGTGTELRGASWSTYQKEFIALDNRYRREADSRLINFGFRILMSGR